MEPSLTSLKIVLLSALIIFLLLRRYFLLPLEHLVRFELEAAEANRKVLKGAVGEMEHSLTSCSNNIATMKTTIKCLTTEITNIQDKCQDLEATLHNNNIRIVGVPEGPNAASTAAFTALFKEACSVTLQSLCSYFTQETWAGKTFEIRPSLFFLSTAKVAQELLRSINDVRYPTRLHITYHVGMKPSLPLTIHIPAAETY